mmetsp:Transcript_23999/g.68970  ORF Transcript_23999/g.68970 Transcript_23999/m.68970 type:complete len:300 (-) Transcript_23999:87-986(-)
MSPIKSLYRRATSDIATTTTCSTADVSALSSSSSSLVSSINHPSPVSSLAALATSYHIQASTSLTAAPTTSPSDVRTDVVVSPSTMIGSGTSISSISDSSTTATPNLPKRERRLVMNRNSARLRRKRHAEKMDQMQDTARDLEISNKRIRTENAELRKAIADLKVQVQAKKRRQEKEQNVANMSTTKDTRYETLAASALTKYTEACQQAAPLKLIPATTVGDASAPPLYLNNVTLRSYLLHRAATLSLFTRNPSVGESSPTTSTHVPPSGISLGVDTNLAEKDAAKLAAEQLTALAFMG